MDGFDEVCLQPPVHTNKNRQRAGGHVNARFEDVYSSAWGFATSGHVYRFHPLPQPYEIVDNRPKPKRVRIYMVCNTTTMQTSMKSKRRLPILAINPWFVIITVNDRVHFLHSHFNKRCQTIEESAPHRGQRIVVEPPDKSKWIYRGEDWQIFNVRTVHGEWAELKRPSFNCLERLELATRATKHKSARLQAVYIPLVCVFIR